MTLVTEFLVTELPLAPPPSGYVQLKTAPLTPVAFSVRFEPVHTDTGLAVAIGADGVSYTVTATVAEPDTHPLNVCVTE